MKSQSDDEPEPTMIPSLKTIIFTTWIALLPTSISQQNQLHSQNLIETLSLDANSPELQRKFAARKSVQTVNHFSRDSLKKMPYLMTHIPHNLVQLLGPEADSILSHFNNYQIDSSKAELTLRDGDTLHVPRITPWLEAYLGTTKEEFLKNYPQYDSVLTHDSSFAFTTQKDWRYIFGYFHNGVLDIACFTSLGTPRTPTPKSIYTTTIKSPYLYSYSYNSPMPYGISLYDGKNLWICAHQWRTTGKGESHGCIRLPMLNAAMFYERVPNRNGKLGEGLKVIVD